MRIHQSRAAASEPDLKASFVRESWPTAYKAAFLITRDKGLAEDFAQEAVLAAIEHFDGHGLAGATRWTVKVAVNRALDWVRSATARRSYPSSELDENCFEGRSQAHVSDPRLAEALAALDADDCAAVVMRYVLGYSAREVGEVFGTSEVAMRSRLHRAMSKLRAKLGEGEFCNG